MIAFDDGTIRLWQSEQNPNVLQVIKLQSAVPGPAHYDLFDMGYQQFDILDTFDIFQNPDDLEEVSEDERLKIKTLYKNKSYPSCEARFFPGSHQHPPPAELYLCFVDALQFVYIRNWQRSEIIKRIPINTLPSCLSIVSFARLQRRLFDETSSREARAASKGFLMALGTKDGRVAVYRLSVQGPCSFNKLYTTRVGLAYGAITAVDL